MLDKVSMLYLQNEAPMSFQFDQVTSDAHGFGRFTEPTWLNELPLS